MLKYLRWIPTFLVMIAIFMASATTSAALPNYGIWDTLVKKGGHMTGYALLATSIWYGFNFERKLIWLAGVLALAYAATDEFHQSFTKGRHPSLVDVFLFDGVGALLGLLFSWGALRWKKRDSSKSGQIS
jgi:VanZ family protein